MCSIAYEKMDPPTESISIFRRLRKVDYRIWFFMFIVGGIAYDVTKLEYLVQYGFNFNTIHIPLYLCFNSFLLYSAVTNNLIAMKIIKIYSSVFLMISTIIATISPIWMIFEFNNGAPEYIRMVLEHGDTHVMEFLQRLGYCVLAELTMILDSGFYAIQMFLAQRTIEVIKSETKEAPVEMDAFNVV